MINNFFDILQDILLKNSGGTLHLKEEFKKYMSSFMLARYLSMNSDLFAYGYIINSWQLTLSPEQIYIWAYNNVPQQKSGYIKYISKKKKDSKK